MKYLREYIDTIVSLYRTANLSDTAQSRPWQTTSDCSTHCRHLNRLLVDICGTVAVDEFIRTDEVEPLYRGAYTRR